MTAAKLKEQVGKRNPFESASQEVYLNLLRTAAVLSGPFHALFKRHRLTEASYNTLRILRGHHLAGETKGVRASRIGEEMVVRVPDVTRLVDRLVDMGLAERNACETDRRVVYVCITKPGLRLLEQLDGPVLELHRRTLGHMSPESLEQFNTLLEIARQECESNGQA
ncbi:MAG: MarR family transcriptional regulator [Phycisphaerales bacterium]|nr:MarR family transcriptional regulator [Planctomycetota bacterium]MCH8509332.1 MarR family transcriptional regulator [Phycisphaerales bacterium]